MQELGKLLHDGVHVSMEGSSSQSVIKGRVQAKCALVPRHVDLDSRLRPNCKDVVYDDGPKCRHDYTSLIRLVGLEARLKCLDDDEDLLACGHLC